MNAELRPKIETAAVPYGRERLFEPFILLPSQLAHHSLSHMGEFRLVAELLQSAIFELENAHRYHKEKDLEYIRELRAWVWSEDTTYIFSFANLCLILSLDVDATRRALLRVDRRVLRSFAWDDQCPSTWEHASQCVEVRDTIAGYHVIFRTPEARYELHTRFSRHLYAQQYGQKMIAEYGAVAAQGGAHGCPR